MTINKNDIVLAKISDSLGKPTIKKVIDPPEYQASIKNLAVLRGIDIAELRVLDVDYQIKIVRASLHASSVLNPDVSTGRAIFITYFSMRNTVTHILRKVLSPLVAIGNLCRRRKNIQKLTGWVLQAHCLTYDVIFNDR